MANGITWAQLDEDWIAYLATVPWGELQWLADTMREPTDRLQQHRVLQEMGRRYAASVGFPPEIWPGT